MTQLIVEIPDHSLLAFGNSVEQTTKMLRMAAAAKLYEMKKLSSGAAAEVAGFSRAYFLERLSDFEISHFEFDEAEFSKETRLA